MGHFGRIETFIEQSPEVIEGVLKHATPFTNRDSMTAATRDPRYASDPVYRAFVRRRVELTPAGLCGVATPTPQAEGVSGDVLEARLAAVQDLFRDPKYKTDPLYRWQVQQRLANVSPSEGHNGGGVHRVELSSAEDKAVDHSALGGAMRVEVKFEETPADKPGNTGRPLQDDDKPQ